MNILKKMLEESGAIESTNEIPAEAMEALKKSIENANVVVSKVREANASLGINANEVSGRNELMNNVFPRICNSMIDNGITQQAWNEADHAARLEMLKKAYTIMQGSFFSMEGNNFLKPGEEITMNVKVSSEDQFFNENTLIQDLMDRKIYGDNHRFVTAEQNGEGYDMKLSGDINIRLTDELVYGRELDTALKPLMLHLLMTAEQASLLQPENALFDAAMQEKWRQEIIEASEGVLNGACAGSIFESALEMLPDFSHSYYMASKVRGV